MKLIIITLTFFYFSSANSQDSTWINFPKNEIRINGLYCVLSTPELSYERSLTKHSSIGTSIMYRIKTNDLPSVGIFPFYRFYIGKIKSTKRLFLESNLGIYSYDYYEYKGGIRYQKNNFQSGIGLAIGGKFNTNDFISIEILGGIGKRLFHITNISNNEFYPRFGLNFGFRFK